MADEAKVYRQVSDIVSELQRIESRAWQALEDDADAPLSDRQQHKLLLLSLEPLEAWLKKAKR